LAQASQDKDFAPSSGKVVAVINSITPLLTNSRSQDA